MLLLKKELSAVGNNQAVHKLHLLDKIPEFRSWIIQYNALLKSLVVKVEEIKLRMNQLYEYGCKNNDSKKYRGSIELQ